MAAFSAKGRLSIIRGHMITSTCSAEEENGNHHNKARDEANNKSDYSWQMKTKAQHSENPLIKYVADHSLRLHPAQEALIQKTQTQKWSLMLSSADEMQLIQNLIRAIDARNVLDVGVYTGYSALSMALALPDDGRVVGCELDPKWPEVGRPFWEEAGITHKIDLRIGKATETLENLLTEEGPEKFDLAFIDADKKNYDNYYELCLKLIRKRGVIIVDNVLWDGKVLDDSDQTSWTRAIRSLNNKLKLDQRVDISMLTVGDGTTILIKR